MSNMLNKYNSIKTKEYAYVLNMECNDTASRTLKLVGTNKKVLELGCSVGTQSEILHNNLGCEVTGVEINPVAAKKAEPYCKNVVIANLDKIDFKSEFEAQYFDVVLCADVLEHLYDPIAMLNQVKFVIRPGGCVVASIPNTAYIGLIYEMMHGKFDYRDKGLLDDTHIRFFTKKTIFKTFSEAGLLVTHLDRGLAKCSQTEFLVEPSNDIDRAALNYIHANNEESETYHFIVKAEPVDLNKSDIQVKNDEFEIADITKMVNYKSSQLLEQEAEISRLRSQVQWIDKRWYLRIGRAFKSCLKAYRHSKN